MKLRLLGHATFVLGAVIVVGCSGANETELFAQPASSELPNEPEEGLPSASTPESSSPTSGSSLVGGGGSSSGASSSGASSSGASSGGASSGGVPDKEPPPAASTILCGPVGPGGAKKTCQAKTQVCCMGWGHGAEFECEAAGALACVARTSIACDDGSDCPSGQVCCGRREENTGYTKVECRTACKNGPGFRAVQFCDPNAAKDECAPSGKCVPSQIMPGYHVCQS